jgi:hypothetical protein
MKGGMSLHPQINHFFLFHSEKVKNDRLVDIIRNLSQSPDGLPLKISLLERVGHEHCSIPIYTPILKANGISLGSHFLFIRSSIIYHLSLLLFVFSVQRPAVPLSYRIVSAIATTPV